MEPGAIARIALALVACVLLPAASCSLIDANVKCRMAGQRLDYSLGKLKLGECADSNGNVRPCCKYQKKTTLSPSLAGCSVAGVEVQLSDDDSAAFLDGHIRGARQPTVKSHGYAESWSRLLKGDGTTGIGAPHSSLTCTIHGCGRATWQFDILRAATDPAIEDESSCPEEPTLLIYVGY